MTVLSTILSFFPTLIILMAGASWLWVCWSPGIFSVLALFFSLYGFPVLAYRIHQYFFPVKEGVSYLLGKDYSSWWGSHQFQTIYIAFPALEVLLRLIPGLFSFWLRLWGAKVGKSVYWTPALEISDRGFVEIGDRVVFGHRIGIYSHVIKPKKQDLMLYVKKVKIGSNVFLGAGSYLAPGSIVEDGTYLPIMTQVYPNKRWK
jgi:hypothetical protein